MDKTIPDSSQLMPRNFRMNGLKVLRDVCRSFSDGRYVKRRCILQLYVLKEFLFGNASEHPIQTLDAFKHMKKPLNVFVHTINHTSDISLRTL